MSKEDPRQIFGSHIRNFRRQAGMSQEKLAEVCDLHRTYVGAVERGERNVSLLNIVALAQALNTKPAELLEGIV